MKKLSLIAVMLMAAITMHGKNRIEMPVWDDPSISVPYAPELTVYIPEEPDGTMLVICPGGGYAGLAINHEGHELADWLCAQGIACAVLRYRLPVDHQPFPQEDARQAIRLMRRHAQEWGIDPKKVGIMGSSAGGHLASSVSTIYVDDESMPNFTVLLYPVISMETGITHDGTRNNLIGADASQEQVDFWSTDKRVTTSTPPAFIAVSADDYLVPLANSLLYTQAMSDHGVPVELHVYPTGGHGWGFRDSFKYKPQWTAELMLWLKQRH